MSYVRLSRKMAEEVHRFLCARGHGGSKAAMELERALTTKPLSSAKCKTAAKKREKRTKTDAVRAIVKRRAGDTCECGCGQKFSPVYGAEPEADHFFGRARAESPQTVWLLRRGCHFHKTTNSPSAGHWLLAFIAHAERHGYHAEAEKARARLAARSDIRSAAALTEGRG